jgi:hypothetical protein
LFMVVSFISRSEPTAPGGPPALRYPRSD